MNWEEAEINLRETINFNEHLAGEEQYKIVTNIPPYICRNFKEEGFRIRVGKTNYINVPISMLRLVFESSIINNGIYERKIFERLYPILCADRPCYVHSLGRLFVRADVMTPNGQRKYSIL